MPCWRAVEASAVAPGTRRPDAFSPAISDSWGWGCRGRSGWWLVCPDVGTGTKRLPESDLHCSGRINAELYRWHAHRPAGPDFVGSPSRPLSQVPASPGRARSVDLAFRWGVIDDFGGCWYLHQLPFPLQESSRGTTKNRDGFLNGNQPWFDRPATTRSPKTVWEVRFSGSR